MAFSPGARAASTALIMLGVVVGASTAASGCTEDAGTTPQSVCGPGQATCQVNLTLLHTSDIHSRLFDYDLLIDQTDAELGLGTENDVKTVGGIARVSYVINRERARSDRVLHLDSGDIWQGAPVFNYFHGEPEVRAETQIFPDAMVIGNHEYDDGALNVATQFMKWANFPVLGANYIPYSVTNPASTRMAALLKPFEVFTQQGLRIAVIGMGNLSTLGSLFNQPNGLGMTSLNTTNVAQAYVDLLRPYVDFVIILSHLGLDADQEMVEGTTGIDIVLGGHNHIVINPPQQLHDCTVDPANPGYIWAVDPNIPYNPDAPPPAYNCSNDPTCKSSNCADPGGAACKTPSTWYADSTQAAYDCSQDPTCHNVDCTQNCTDPSTWILLPDPVNHPYEFERPCKPRKVIIEHSGAFAKYVGRDDLILSNDPAEVSPTGDPADYDPNNGFEILSNAYQVFPIDTTVPQDPVMVDLLFPYQRVLDFEAELDLLVGFAPNEVIRTAPQGGDAPLGNLVATSMWLRLGVQTDFSLTNTTGIRTDMNPGPVTIEEMFNIFPFNNAITKMELSGLEVQELFDYVAQYSQGRGCVSQAQIAGARVRLNCSGCTRPGASSACVTDSDCIGGEPGSCQRGQCDVIACADQIFIGHRTCSTAAECGENFNGGCSSNGIALACTCSTDTDCGGPPCVGASAGEACSNFGTGGTCLPNAAGTLICSIPGICDIPAALPGQTSVVGTCSDPIASENLYQLATSDYLAGGGSGYYVLKRNTTQQDTYIQQRDALTDYIRQGGPCGSAIASDGTKIPLPSCTVDSDCTAAQLTGGAYVCACAGHEHTAADGTSCQTDPGGCAGATGQCVLSTCRDQVAAFHEAVCDESPNRAGCLTDLNGCSIAGEECKYLSCVNQSIGSVTDNRVEMVGR
ncbi:MAG: bifunctional metallophosphatase/5'-nucleotidase [Polyangiaceae bacterium]